MVGKDKNGNDDFEMEDFPEGEYDESNFDEGEFAETDNEYAGDEYVDEEYEDWQADEEEEPANRKSKKDKSLYSGGEGKKGLSFNTIVIIGGVLLGGAVMGINIMSKTAEQKENQKSIFKSMLDISGVMDGTLFSSGDEQQQVPAQPAAQNAQQQEGFLNNPDAVGTAAPKPETVPAPVPGPNAAQPPQPSPVMPEPSQSASALTPLPGESAAQTPRGPDDLNGSPASSAPVPDVTAPIAPPADTAAKDVQPSKEIPAASSVSSELVGMSDLPPVRNEGDKPVPFQAESQTQGSVRAPSPATAAAIGENFSSASTAALEAKVDDLLKRMDRIEAELKSVKGGDYASVQKNLDELKKEVGALQSGASVPAAKAKPKKAETAAASVEEQPSKAPARPKKVASSKPKAASTAPPVSKRWELRAAQPGRAWVSKPGERDMQTVEVGQSLPGIGTVTAITYQNSRWTVHGTQGQIQQ